MATKLVDSVVVDDDVAHVFALWSNFELYPNFLRHLRSVTRAGRGKVHWVMEGALGHDLEWNAIITAMDPNRKIAWKSVDGDLDAEGEVTLRELGPNQTEVTLMLRYEPRAEGPELGAMGVLDDPEENLAEDLEHFREYAEGRVHPGR